VVNRAEQFGGGKRRHSERISHKGEGVGKKIRRASQKCDLVKGLRRVRLSVSLKVLSPERKRGHGKKGKPSPKAAGLNIGGNWERRLVHLMGGEEVKRRKTTAGEKGGEERGGTISDEMVDNFHRSSSGKKSPTTVKKQDCKTKSGRNRRKRGLQGEKVKSIFQGLAQWGRSFFKVNRISSRSWGER